MKDSFAIHDLPVSERPRERLQGCGSVSPPAQEILALILGRGIEATPEAPSKPLLKTPEDVFKLVGGSPRGKKRGRLLLILLDTRSRLIKVCQLSVGSLDSSIVHPGEVFLEAVSASAASVILAHNHPSWDSTPLEDGIRLSRGLAQAGELMGVEVLDHIIIGGNSYLSLKREGLF